jgi:L-malate glycosyltransferase
MKPRSLISLRLVPDDELSVGIKMQSVVIVQRRLPHYRVPFFEGLREFLAGHGIRLALLHGLAPASEQSKNDAGNLAWATSVASRSLRILGREFVWQHIHSAIGQANLVILSQENKLVSNFPILFGHRSAQRKVAFWGHGANLQSDRPQGLSETVKRLIATRVDWWFAYSEITHAYIKALGYPENRITTVNNAVDSARLQADLDAVTEADLALARHTLGIGQEAFVACFCGSLYEEKRIPFLLEVARRVKQTHPGFFLIIMGDGALRGEVERFAAENRWVHFAGFVAGKQKALLLKLSQIMLNPGLAGLNVVDAFCGGLVFLTTHNKGHGPEIAYLEHGHNGLITEPNIEQYKQQIGKLIDAPQALAVLRKQARGSASQYSIGQMVNRFGQGVLECLDVERD